MASHCHACDSLIEDRKANTANIQNTLYDVAEQQSRPPFAEYLDLVSFVAVITISFALSASQGFATSQSLFGVTLAANTTDETTQRALERTTHMATLLSWSAATSAFSLMIALALRILQTYDVFVYLSRKGNRKERRWYGKMPRIVCVGGSWTALFSQAASIGLIGQSLKAISLGSGWMIQVDLTRCQQFERQLTYIAGLVGFHSGHGYASGLFGLVPKEDGSTELGRRA